MRLLAYISSSTVPQTTALLQSIVRDSHHNNSHDSITGLLLANGGWFFQVVEGESDKVGALFERLSVDSRHAGITKLFDVSVRRRVFQGEPLVLTLVGQPDATILASRLFSGIACSLAAHLGPNSGLGERVRQALAERGVNHG